jgi:hypothetical protein
LLTKPLPHEAFSKHRDLATNAWIMSTRNTQLHA